MTSPHWKESINWPDGIRRWTINIEDLEDLNEVIMPYRVSNKRLSLDFETSPLRLLGKQTSLSPRVSSAIIKYSNDTPLSLRLQKAKMHRGKKVYPTEMEQCSQITANSLYGLQCIWTEDGQKDDLPMHVLCNVTEKQDNIIAEYEDVNDLSKPKIFLKARRCSEGELSNCMRRLKLNGCPVIVCHETDDDTFTAEIPQDQSSATCLTVPPIDVENEKKRPPLPNEQVDIVVC